MLWDWHVHCSEHGATFALSHFCANRVISLIIVGKSSVLHSRQWSVGQSAGRWGSSAPNSLPVGSLLAILDNMQQLLVTVSISRGARIFIHILFFHAATHAPDECSRNRNCDKKVQTFRLPLALVHSIPFKNECPINFNVTALKEIRV